MRRPLVVSRRAERQIASAAGWWQANRLSAPARLADELIAAFELLRHEPHAGKPVVFPSGRTARRVTLERCRYYLYYRISPHETVHVLALWHTSRRPPRL